MTPEDLKDLLSDLTVTQEEADELFIKIDNMSIRGDALEQEAADVGQAFNIPTWKIASLRRKLSQGEGR